MYIHTQTNTHRIHACVLHTHVYTYIHTTYTYTHTHTHTHTHTYRLSGLTATDVTPSIGPFLSHKQTHTHTHIPVVGTDSDRCDAILRALVVSERTHTLAGIDVPQLRALVTAPCRVYTPKKLL
jgi:hypothetical protein